MAFVGLINSKGAVSRLTGTMPIANYADYPIPIIYLSGSMAGMTKDDTATLNYVYKDRSGTCTLKWQGSSSVNRPKKNFTIKFDEAFEIVSGWGAQKKYVLKANFVDASHARNIACAKLWGQIVKSRTPANATLNALPNGGAVDGFPIIVALNGDFYGLYTLNIPKDPWMFGMDGTGQQAILCAELNNNGAVYFKALATLEEDANGQLDFDLEYNSSDDQKDWVLASLNRLIGAVMDSDGTNIEYGITPYLDWESAIDYYIHAVLTANYDGIARNYLLSTYDGVKWFFTGYDMDVVFGLRAMGKYFYSPESVITFAEVASVHALFGLVWKYMRPQLRARYNELRAAAMSVGNVQNAFADFVADIPLPVYVDDYRKWNAVPSTGANNIAQIITWYDLRCRNADEWVKNTSGETALPGQVNPSVVAVTNTLTNCTTSNSATTASKGAAYTATITANDGYELSSVKVTMGGVDITSTAYSNGVVSIASVTGNIVITAIAEKKSSYTNQVPISIDTDGSVYNGKGWIAAKRLSSSGVLKDSNYTSTTGYIPASSGAVISIKGPEWLDTANQADNYVCAYDSSFNFISAVNCNGSYGGGTVGGDLTIANVTLNDNANIAYVRVSCKLTSENAAANGFTGTLTDGPGSYMIVTINEEIV